ncbi:MAG: amidohydrolase family protein [Bacillota bacterium]|jgi:5-methylthioadenosine/S-adenosylhomocysteine deaminase
MKKKVNLLIMGGTVITVDKERRIIVDGALAVADNRIVEVGKRADLEAAYEGVQVIDAGDKIIMPGLIDSHTHFHDPVKGFIPDDVISREWVIDYMWPAIANTDEELEYWGAMANMAYKIRTGTTCFTECGSPSVDNVVEAIKEAGVRVNLGPYIWDQIGWGKYGPPLDTTEGALQKTVDLIHKYNGHCNGKIQIFSTTEAVGTASDALLIGLKEIADEYDIWMQAHCATSTELVAATLKRTGHREVEHFNAIGILGPNLLLGHCIDLNDDEVDMLKDADVKVVMNPGAAIRQVKGITQLSKFPRMLREGITIGIGIDSFNSTCTGDLIQMARLGIGLIRDMSMDSTIAGAEKAVEMITIDGAKANGMEDRIGSLEPGKLADIIIINPRRPEWVPMVNVISNLIWAADGDSVDTVIVDGEIIYNQGKYKGINIEEIVVNLERLTADFLKKMEPYAKPKFHWPLV